MCTGCYVILASDGIIKWHAENHMNTNNLLVPEECGLRIGMSTSDAVIELTHKILKSFNKNKHHHGKVGPVHAMQVYGGVEV